MNNDVNLKPRLMQSKDAAAYLAISKRKLWDLSHKKIIPPIRIGRAVRYDREDLDGYISRAKEWADINKLETKQKAQLQIGLLYAHSDPAEQRKLEKYLKPMPAIQRFTVWCSEPIHIKQILPSVMADIRWRMLKARLRAQCLYIMSEF